MSWAAYRETTREENAAYCLMGMFDVNMPLLYGEGPKAFQRLQQEILKQSHDESLLVWNCNGTRPCLAAVSHNPGLLIAPSPACFATSMNVYSKDRSSSVLPWSVTSQGLDLEAQAYRLSFFNRIDMYMIQLNCHRILPAGESACMLYLLRHFPASQLPGHPTQVDVRCAPDDDMLQPERSFRCSEGEPVGLTRFQIRSKMSYDTLQRIYL